MPVFKLYYFKGRGRAEVARMLFTIGGVEFEDVRLQGQDWLDFKSSTPMGQMPVLKIDDVMLCQSNTISRYLANKFELAGNNDLEKAQADMIVDCLDDMAKPLMAIFSAKTDEEKEAIKTKYTEEQAPDFLGKLQEILSKNKGGDGWFVGDGLTWADIQFYNMIDFPESQMGLNMGLEKFQKLNNLKKRVHDHPKVQEWINKRPA